MAVNERVERAALGMLEDGEFNESAYRAAAVVRLVRLPKSSDQASSQIAASAVTKVTEQTGGVAINPQFDAALRFADGLAAVRNGDKWGYISR